MLLRISQPFSNHNGGQLAFGPDGFLYIGTGDGGSGGDPGNRAQSLTTLLGKILRIDVDGGTPYAIPPDNPFSSTASALPEIWAYGLRNPWRFSFDRATGDLLIADVGQNAFEEINFQPAQSSGGENYGWRLMEASHCFNPASNCNDGSLTLPILEYGRGEGCSVTGGYVFRGRSPGTRGMYIYGDFCSGTIWFAAPDEEGRWTNRLEIQSGLSISSFGEAANGEIYVAGYGGTIHRIVELPERRRGARRQ